MGLHSAVAEPFIWKEKKYRVWPRLDAGPPGRIITGLVV
jgi:hypothetical protein